MAPAYTGSSPTPAVSTSTGIRFGGLVRIYSPNAWRLRRGGILRYVLRHSGGGMTAGFGYVDRQHGQRSL